MSAWQIILSLHRRSLSLKIDDSCLCYFGPKWVILLLSLLLFLHQYLVIITFDNFLLIIPVCYYDQGLSCWPHFDLDQLHSDMNFDQFPQFRHYSFGIRTFQCLKGNLRHKLMHKDDENVIKIACFKSLSYSINLCIRRDKLLIVYLSHYWQNNFLVMTQ